MLKGGHALGPYATDEIDRDAIGGLPQATSTETNRIMTSTSEETRQSKTGGHAEGARRASRSGRILSLLERDSLEVVFEGQLDVDGVRAWLGMTQAEVALFTGKDRRTVARWSLAAKDRTEPRSDAARSLRQLSRLKYLLENLADEHEAQRWLRAPSRAFRGEAPIDVILNGHIERVVAELEALADGGTY